MASAPDIIVRFLHRCSTTVPLQTASDPRARPLWSNWTLGCFSGPLHWSLDLASSTDKHTGPRLVWPLCPWHLLQPTSQHPECFRRDESWGPSLLTRHHCFPASPAAILNHFPLLRHFPNILILIYEKMVVSISSVNVPQLTIELLPMMVVKLPTHFFARSAIYCDRNCNCTHWQRWSDASGQWGFCGPEKDFLPVWTDATLLLGEWGECGAFNALQCWWSRC